MTRIEDVKIFAFEDAAARQRPLWIECRITSS
jgi:hypothetical protein